MNDILGKVNKPIFWSTFIICLFVVIAGITWPTTFNNAVNAIDNFITLNFGWYFMLLIAAIVVFCLWCAFGPYAQVKLGKDDEKPEYGNFHWFAMLFSCGIGIGLIFWGVAEPLYHYFQCPVYPPASPEAAEYALRTIVFHWGIHGWATYAVVGGAMAYFSFRLGKPMTFATSLYGILGERTESLWGGIINILAVIATIFGVTTAIGISVIQIKYGLKFIFGIPATTLNLIILTIIITGMYTASAVSGLKRGIRFLSSLNIYLALGIIVFLFIFGPKRFILNMFTNTIGQYLQNFIAQSFWTDPVQQHQWLRDWTVFYWAWWITWAPFVGGFIARISRGRTIRQFMTGVLFIPTAFIILWYSVIGGSTLHAQIFNGVKIWEGVQQDIGSGIFTLLTEYPCWYLVSIVVIINLFSWLVTSADSAAFWISMIMSKGELEPKPVMKLLWGFFMGALAVILLITGGLEALQTTTILAALPFSLVMIAIIYSTVISLKKEHQINNTSD